VKSGIGWVRVLQRVQEALHGSFEKLFARNPEPRGGSTIIGQKLIQTVILLIRTHVLHTG